MEFATWSKEALEEKKKALMEDLEEANLEKNMITHQTGLHINADKIQERTKELHAAAVRYETELAAIEEELKRRGV